MGCPDHFPGDPHSGRGAAARRRKQSMERKSRAREWADVLSRLGLITQLGLTLVTPPLLLVLGAQWLMRRFALGDWLLLAAIVVGVLSGLSGALSLIRAELARDRRAEKKRDSRPPHAGDSNET